MTMRSAVILSMLACAWLALPTSAEEPTVFFQCHRGGLEEVPENTLPAVEHAWSIPGGVPEVDLETTRDGVIILSHDPTPERATNAQVPISSTPFAQLDYEQVKQLDAGIKFAEEYKGTPVPTLEDVFIRMVSRPERQIYLDLKRADTQQLLGLIDKYNLRQQIIFVHGNPAMCRKLSQLWPGARVMTWISDSGDMAKRRFDKLAEEDFFGVKQLQFHLKVKDAGPPIVYELEDDYIKSCAEHLKGNGIDLQLRPFAFDAASLRHLVDLGVHWYVTDAPRKFTSVLQEGAATAAKESGGTP